MGRWGLALGPDAVEKIHERVVEIAQEHQVVEGRKMRLDTTVVETNIHYPTDSNLLGDGVRVLIRTMKRIAEIAGQQGAKLRDRSRSGKLRILAIGRIARTRGGPNRERLQQGYEKLLSSVGRVVGQAKRFSGEMVQGVKRSADVMQQAALEGLRKELDTFVPRVQQVMRQAKQRIFGGDTHVAEKLVSIFEPTTEIIRKGKASKPTEFGKMVNIQEGENQILTDYDVHEKHPSDSALVIPPSMRMRKRWAVLPAWWRATRPSTPPGTKRPRTREVSSACAFRIAPQKAPSGSANKRSAGSNKDRSGGPVARAGSASSSAGMDFAVASTGAMPE